MESRETDIKEVCRVIDETGSIKRAAEALGLKYHEAYRIAVVHCGYKPRRKERVSQELKKAVCEMLLNGLKVTEVARKLGVGVGTVERIKEEYCRMAKKRSWKSTGEEERLEICKKLSECWGTRGCQKTVARTYGKSEATISRIARWCKEKGVLS